eukprot:scaffold32423_cov140-Isochrysis_galbana.AAC.2
MAGAHTRWCKRAGTGHRRVGAAALRRARGPPADLPLADHPAVHTRRPLLCRGRRLAADPRGRLWRPCGRGALADGAAGSQTAGRGAAGPGGPGLDAAACRRLCRRPVHHHLAGRQWRRRQRQGGGREHPAQPGRAVRAQAGGHAAQELRRARPGRALGAVHPAKRASDDDHPAPQPAVLPGGPAQG